MAVLSTKQRNALPDADFGYVAGSGEKKIRLFPITDQDDVDSAKRLIGKSPDPEGTKKRIIAICKRKNLTPPDAWVGAANNSAGAGADPAVVTFSADDLIVRVGKVFAVGDYADKNFSLTEDELHAAIRNLEPVPVDFGHPGVDSPLDGKFGDVIDAWVGDDPGDMEAAVALPRWLDEMLPPDGRKVSAAWDRQTKRLRALSFVNDPRIDGAALMAAFAARHDTHEGQAAIQRVHDVAAQAGAVCKQANATMSSAHEMTGIQAVHDTAVSHGARCNAIGSGSPLALYSAQPPTVTEKPRKGFSMSWFADLFKLAKDAPEGFDPEAVFGATKLTPPVTAVLQQTAGDSEKDTLRAELARERAKNIQRDAAVFADKLIEVQHKAFPSEREAIITAYTQSAQDDVLYGTVTFASGQSGNRVGVLTAAYDARPAHQLTVEQLAPGLNALFNQQVTQNPNDPNRPLERAELDNLLSKTALGSTVLRERNGARN